MNGIKALKYSNAYDSHHLSASYVIGSAYDQVSSYNILGFRSIFAFSQGLSRRP